MLSAEVLADDALLLYLMNESKKIPHDCIDASRQGWREPIYSTATYT